MTDWLKAIAAAVGFIAFVAAVVFVISRHVPVPAPPPEGVPELLFERDGCLVYSFIGRDSLVHHFTSGDGCAVSARRK